MARTSAGARAGPSRCAAPGGLCAHLCATLPRLDIIVNNACQTIRRPPAYYAHLLEAEDAPPPTATLPLLAQLRTAQVGGGHAEGSAASAEGARAEVAGGNVAEGDSSAAALRQHHPRGHRRRCGRRCAANREWRQAHGAIGCHVAGAARNRCDLAVAGGVQFPSGRLDVNEQQLDLRTTNSWLSGLAGFDAGLVEVLAINTISPFVLNSRLHPLLA